MSKKQKIALCLISGYLIITGGLTLFSKEVMKHSLIQVQTCISMDGYIDGEYYETVLPADCILEDGGSFLIYELTERDTPIGIRHYVKKRQVEIRDQKDGMAAVRPILEWKTRVVQHSSGVLSDGMQVNIASED